MIPANFPELPDFPPGEVWLAAEHESDEALAEELSQLLYWAQVMMIARGLTLDDVYRKL